MHFLVGQLYMDIVKGKSVCLLSYSRFLLSVLYLMFCWAAFTVLGYFIYFCYYLCICSSCLAVSTGAGD